MNLHDSPFPLFFFSLFLSVQGGERGLLRQKRKGNLQRKYHHYHDNNTYLHLNLV